MINVYIKSFARPFYLDRCIRSIKFNLTGYDRIIVLDDGTLSADLDRIAALHPEVEIRSSGADDGKFKLLSEQKFAEIARQYPSAPEFWHAEISKDPYEYTIVIEDDAWFVRHIDLQALLECMGATNTAMCKFWWSNHQYDVVSRYTAPRGPELEFYAQSGSIAEISRTLWIVAFALFKRDYWLHVVSHAHRLGDERSQSVAAVEYASEHPDARFCKTAKRCIHQGWAVPARSTPEYYGKKLMQHRIMEALNGAWASGEWSPAESYPYDFSRDYVIQQLRARLSDDDVEAWSHWHATDVAYWYG